MSSHHKPIIMIIDDETTLRKTIVQFLSAEGFHVQEAFNGRDALNILRSDAPHPCLLLLDLMMPVMDGREFRREQLRDPRLCHIPVALMSAGRLTPEVLLEMAPAAIVNKPFNIDAFLGTVKNLCG